MVSRLYNLGNYQNARYDLTATVEPGESALRVTQALTMILKALKPINQTTIEGETSLTNQLSRIKGLEESLRKLSADELKRTWGPFEGSPRQYLIRCRRSYDIAVKRRRDYLRKVERARKLFDNLGGIETWKDASMDWEDPL